MAFSSMLLAALGIGLLIFIHEAGHFLAARAAGVRVEVFSLGFGPRLCGWVWRGTDFRLSLVPFGGYVMVAGQDPSDRRYPASESLWSKSVGQRALFWSGGVLMNLLFALIAFPIVFGVGVDFEAPVIGRVTAGSAAWEADLAPGDRVLAIDGKAIHAFDMIVMDVALAGGRELPLTVRSTTGAERTVRVLPQWDAAEGRYALGVFDSFVDEPPTMTVDPDGAAAAAGLKDGDVLLAIAGVPVRGPGTDPWLQELLRKDAAPVAVAVRTKEGERTVSLTPRPATEPGPFRIGVTLLPRVVAGIKHGAAGVERLGLRRGDLLLAIDGVPFTGGALDGLAGPAGRVALLVRRGEQTLELGAELTAEERAALPRQIALTPDERLMLLPSPDGAAARAGLLAGDRIESVDGDAVATLEELRDAVEGSDGKAMHVVVRRMGPADGVDRNTGELVQSERREITIPPAREALFELGLSPRMLGRVEEVRAESFGGALALGTARSLAMLKQLYLTMKRMVTGDVGAKNLGGIIRISQVSYHAAQKGPTWFLYLLAMLSLNLAFVNLLPIPVLDGGHLMFLLIEAVKGSPVSSRVFGYSQVVGLVFVLMLVLFVTYNDILRLL